jgi:hypothetical protein
LRSLRSCRYYQACLRKEGERRLLGQVLQSWDRREESAGLAQTRAQFNKWQRKCADAKMREAILRRRLRAMCDRQVYVQL